MLKQSTIVIEGKFSSDRFLIDIFYIYGNYKYNVNVHVCLSIHYNNNKFMSVYLWDIYYTHHTIHVQFGTYAYHTALLSFCQLNDDDKRIFGVIRVYFIILYTEMFNMYCVPNEKSIKNLHSKSICKNVFILCTHSCYIIICILYTHTYFIII